MKINIRLFWISIIFISIFSCQKTEEKEVSKSSEYEINKEFSSGPLTLNIKIDKKQITIAEKIELVIEAIAEKEYNVELPEFGENLNEFSIIDFYAPGPKLLDNEHMISTQSYDLEPFLSGEYSIPPMKIKFWTDEEGPEDPHILESEEIKITVNSILEDSNEELMIVDVTPPVIPPPPDRTWIIFLILGLLGGGGIIAGLIYWFKTQKKTRQQINTIPAHQLAYRELEWLVKQDLIENGKFKLFYFGISCVLRHYIENRFNLHAPEQTTEEFLNELNLNNILQPNQKKLLQNFLNHCDLVKFAELVPSNEEIQSTFNTCKEFIIETENTEAQIIEPEGSQIKLTQNEVE